MERENIDSAERERLTYGTLSLPPRCTSQSKTARRPGSLSLLKLVKKRPDRENAREREFSFPEVSL